MGLLNRIEELERELLELKELVKEEQEFPQYGDVYWYIETKGKVLKERWDGFGFEIDVIEMGNVFRTKEQADFAVEKLKVEAELRKYGRPFDECYNNYFMKIDSVYNTIVVYDEECHQTQGVIYFESEKKAEEAIESVGEERIKKYIFRVED